jgi:GR25 family glycosyltransferase involved in LPS biosynthesis
MNTDITNKINKYIDSIDIIYWINLDRSVERRKNMEQNLKHFNIKQKRIQATDAKLTENIYSNFINDGEFNRTKIEYAVLHSHVKTIEEFSNSPYELALIFEDDISLEYVHLWGKKISDIIKDAPKDWDIIMLAHIFKYQLNELYTLNRNGKISSCLSYIINKNSAKKLINMIKKDNKYILHNNRIHTADDYIYSLLKTYTYKYPYFTYPNDNDSTIHPQDLSYHNYSKNIAEKNWREKYNKTNLNDIFYCDFLSLKSISILLIIFIIMFLIINYFIKNINRISPH